MTSYFRETTKRPFLEENQKHYTTTTKVATTTTIVARETTTESRKIQQSVGKDRFEL